MTREDAIFELEQMKTWSKDYSDEEIEAISYALHNLHKLDKIEQIINDPLVKAFGSIGINKIREILGEEDKPCQMQ